MIYQNESYFRVHKLSPFNEMDDYIFNTIQLIRLRIMKAKRKAYRNYTQPIEPHIEDNELMKLNKNINLNNIRFSADNDHFPFPTGLSKNEHYLNLKREDQDHTKYFKHIGGSQKLPGLPNISEPVSVEIGSKKKEFLKKESLLNSIIEILKPNDEITDQLSNKNKSLKLSEQLDRRNFTNKRQYINEFSNLVLSHNSTKNHRGPKVIENEMTRIGKNQSVMRRKIASQQKTRVRSLFGPPKQSTKSKPDMSFDAIQILTFSNKFPGVKSRQNKEKTQEIKRQSRALSNQFFEFLKK